jgi:CTP:molybdopterin cytidylyltransferase MocA
LIDGRPALEVHVEFFERLMGAGSVSASIQGEWADRCRALSLSTRWVPADPDAPALDSLKRMIAASPLSRSFVLHVDMLVHDAAVYRRLWETEGEAVVPMSRGRRGHPVLLGPAALAEVSALDGLTGRLDVYLRGRNVAEVEVEDAAVLVNANEARP